MDWIERNARENDFLTGIQRRARNFQSPMFNLNPKRSVFFSVRERRSPAFPYNSCDLSFLKRHVPESGVLDMYARARARVSVRTRFSIICARPRRSDNSGGSPNTSPDPESGKKTRAAKKGEKGGQRVEGDTREERDK